MITLKKSAAVLLAVLLATAGLTAIASPAAAAPGDVAGATLNWGIKTSFTNYIQGPIAHGGWTVSGSVTQAAPFSWTGGSGAASQAGATGSVDYGSSIHFTGHDGALDVTFSNFRVVQQSATAASVVLDAVYSSLSSPGTVSTVTGITFATVDLASATNASTATTVAYTGAPAVLTADGAAAFAGFYGAGTALDTLSFSWPIEQPPVPPTPTITVSKTEGLHPGGETITVTGTGFNPQPPATNGTRPPLAGQFGGAYVVFGKFADTWKPSAGAPSSARKVGDQKWVVDPANVAALGAQAVAINPDGSFTLTLTATRNLDANPGNYGIYTYGGSGAGYTPFETYTPVSFSTTPIVSVSQTSDLDPNGDTVTVRGWNFGPNPPATTGTRPPLSGKFGGSYVIFGKFADIWKPSAGAPSSARKVGDQKWVVDAADAAGLGAQAVAVSADGSFSLTLSVAQNLDAFAGNYGIYTYPGSGASYAAFETYTPIAFTPATQTTTTLAAAPATGLVAGQSTTLTATVSPLAAGTLEILSGSTVLFSEASDADGSSLLVTGLTEGSRTYTARFTPTDPLSFASSASAPLVLEVGPAPIVPTVTVSKTEGLHPGGETITITGTGFLPNPPATNGARPPLAGTFAGAYVVFGKFADTWKPSAGAPSSARKVGDQKWVVNAADVPGLGAQAVALSPDGSFSLTLNVGRTLDANPGNYGIYTFAGSGAVYAPFETYTPIAFDTAPLVSVSKVQHLNPAGDTVTVRGWNFTPNAPGTTATRPPLVGGFGGAYVVFGKFADTWKPSAGATSAARGTGDQAWVVAAADAATVGGVALSADGSFTVELDVSSLPQFATGNYGVYTYAGGGAVYAPFETATPVSFTAAAATTVTLTANPATGLTAGDALTLKAVVTPTAAEGDIRFAEGGTVLGTVPLAAGSASLSIAGVTAGAHTVTATFLPDDADQLAWSTATLTYDVAPLSVGAGSLTWGIKASFRDYVTGSIAQGSITTVGAGTSGGAFVFGQAAGASFDPATNTGRSPYSGSVRFVGHGGILDVSIANPVIRVDSASSATLLVTANGTQLSFATLNLAAGTRTSSGNTVGWSGVPATLTAAGSGVFSYNGSAFYPAGTALDPVTFVIGSPSSGGGSATVAAFEGLRQPAATPPATTGITVDEASLKNLKAGSQVTITADGFESNEEDVLVVIYSDPMLLDRTTADANGTVTWTGRLPASLTGEHTLTLQGSVSRGIVLNIPAKVTTAADGCPVDDATLTWGFKETFRSYISGSIANGEWTVADGATYTTPDFGWTDGTGAYEPQAEGLIAFTGSIRFTGHGGVLDTTVANPQLRFLGDGTAVLLLDVSGTTQEGAPIDQKAVEFVELDLQDALTIDGDTVTITAAPAVLTPAGATAFGTYPADEEFDPVSATFTLPADCADPVVAETGAAGEPTSSAGPDLGWLVWVILGLAVLAGALIVVIAIVRRRSAA